MSSEHIQEASLHGRLIKEYREKAGITQEELAGLIGKSRRTIISIEQVACIKGPKLCRTLAWVLHIPPQLLGFPEINLPKAAILHPLESLPSPNSKSLSRVVLETPTPFHCFSWEDWLQMQTKMLHAFSRFQHAITQQRVEDALAVADEVITMGVELLYEARQWLKP